VQLITRILLTLSEQSWLFINELGMLYMLASVHVLLKLLLVFSLVSKQTKWTVLLLTLNPWQTFTKSSVEYQHEQIALRKYIIDVFVPV